MFGLTFFSPFSVATTSRTTETSVDLMPDALAPQVALEAKTPEAVVAEAQAIMAMPEPDQQQVCLVAMGLGTDEADELLDTIAELQEQGVDLAKYPTLNEIIDEMFNRLDVYAKIVLHGEEVNTDLLLEVSRCLRKETLELIQSDLAFLMATQSKKNRAKHKHIKIEKLEQKQSELTDGLVAYYPFSGDSIQDFSGNGFNGILVGGEMSSSIDLHGLHNQALYFNGEGDYFYIQNNLLLQSNTISVALWAKFSARTDLHLSLLINAHGGGGYKGWVIQYDEYANALQFAYGRISGNHC